MSPFEALYQAAAVATIVAALATIAAVIVGLRALSTWRKQNAGAAEASAALRSLSGILRLRAAIQQFRSPLMYSNEAVPGGSNGDFEERVLEHRRVTLLAPLISELAVALADGEIFWGSEFSNRAQPLAECVRDLAFQTEEYIRRRRGGPGIDPASPFLAVAEEVVKDRGSKQAPDAFSRRVNEAVSSLEAFLRPKLAVAPSKAKSKKSLNRAGHISKGR